MFDLSCDAAITIMMQLTFNTHMFLAEVAPVASALPCRQSRETKRDAGYVQALAGRFAS